MKIEIDAIVLDAGLYLTLAGISDYYWLRGPIAQLVRATDS